MSPIEKKKEKLLSRFVSLVYAAAVGLACAGHRPPAPPAPPTSCAPPVAPPRRLVLVRAVVGHPPSPNSCVPLACPRTASQSSPAPNDPSSPCQERAHACCSGGWDARRHAPAGDDIALGVIGARRTTSGLPAHRCWTPLELIHAHYPATDDRSRSQFTGCRHTSAPKSSAASQTTTIRCATYLLDEMPSLLLEAICFSYGGCACAAAHGFILAAVAR